MQRIITFLFLFTAFVIYSFFVYTKGTDNGAVIMNEDAIKGKLLYQQYNCTSCHQLFGLGGYLGPELTTVISQPGKGPQYAKAFFKSGINRMPDFHLNNQQIDELIAYLTYVDETATSYKTKINL